MGRRYNANHHAHTPFEAQGKYLGSELDFSKYLLNELGEPIEQLGFVFSFPELCEIFHKEVKNFFCLEARLRCDFTIANKLMKMKNIFFLANTKKKRYVANTTLNSYGTEHHLPSKRNHDPDAKIQDKGCTA